MFWEGGEKARMHRGSADKEQCSFGVAVTESVQDSEKKWENKATNKISFHYSYI